MTSGLVFCKHPHFDSMKGLCNEKGGHKESWGGHFPWFPIFKEVTGGTPKKCQFFFYQKLPNNHIFKVRGKNHVFYAKLRNV